MFLDNTKKIKTKKGAAALVTLMIMSIGLLSAGVTLIYNTIDTNKATKNHRGIAVLHSESNSCIEEALLKIKRNPTFTGVINLTLDNSTCTATISAHPTNPSYKVVVVDSTDGDYNYSISRTVAYTQDPMVLIK